MLDVIGHGERLPSPTVSAPAHFAADLTKGLVVVDDNYTDPGTAGSRARIRQTLPRDDVVEFHVTPEHRPGLPGLCKLFSVSRTLPAAVAARHDRQVVDRMLEMHSQSPIEAERQLLAIEQIKRLQAAYFRTLDGKLWDELAQLFTPDCEFITYRDPDNVDPKRRCGRDAIVASIRRTVGDALTLHQGQLLEIDIGARDSATAVWEMQDYAEIPEGALVRILRGAGRYYEHYRLLGGQWMIARLELKRTSLLIE